MPNIPIYEAKVQPTAKIRSQATAEDFGAGIGRAQQSLAAQVQNASEVYQKITEEREVYEAKKAVTQAGVDWAEKQQKSQMEAPLGAEGFAESQKQAYSDWRTQQDAGFHTRAANDVLESGLNNVGNTLFIDNLGFEAKSYGAKQRQDAEKIFGAQENAVRSRPDAMPFFKNEMEQLVDSMPGVDAVTKNEIKNMQNQKLHGSALDGIVTGLETDDNVTPGQVDAAIAQLKDERAPYLKNASPADYNNALTRLQRLKETTNEKGNKLALMAFEEDMRQYQTTGENRNGWTEEEALTLAKGADDVTRVKIGKTFRAAEAVGAEVARSADTPFAEDVSRVTGMEKNLGQTDDFDVNADRYRAAVQAYTQKRQAYNKDPAGYTISNSPAVSSAWAKYQASPSPEAFQQYAVTSWAQQSRLLAGEKSLTAESTTLVPDEMSSNVAEQMASIPNSDIGASQAGDILADLQKNAGQYWPQVARDLYAKKALDETQYVAATVAGGSHPHMAQELLRANAKPNSEWAKISQVQGAENLARSAAISALSGSKSALIASGGESVYTAQVEALTKLGLYRQALGKKPDIRGAAKNMFLEDYTFIDSSHSQMRIPRTVDPSLVRSGTGVILKNLDTMNIVPYTSSEGIRPEDNKADYVNKVRSFGTWVTNSDETGARLTDDLGRPVMEAVPYGSADVEGNVVGRINKGNIDLTKRPSVSYEGKIATVRSITIETDRGAILLPTVVGNKVVSNDEAIKHFRETGQHLGVFRTEAEANAYAEKLHQAQERYYTGGRPMPIERTWAELGTEKAK